MPLDPPSPVVLTPNTHLLRPQDLHQSAGYGINTAMDHLGVFFFFLWIHICTLLCLFGTLLNFLLYDVGMTMHIQCTHGHEIHNYLQSLSPLPCTPAAHRPCTCCSLVQQEAMVSKLMRSRREDKPATPLLSTALFSSYQTPYAWPVQSPFLCFQ